MSSKLSIKDSANQFGFELFKVFLSRHRNDYHNFCFSPFAVFNSLAMILIGSRNQTREQLKQVLHLTHFETTDEYKELMALRESIIKGNHEIILSDSYLYVDQSVQLKPEYKKILKEYFEVKPKFVVFSKTEETLNIINSDAKDSTDGVIDNVIDAKDITDNWNVKLILTNMLFFRGYWATSFGSPTKQLFKFTVKNTSQFFAIQMISHIGRHRYFHDEKLRARIVSLSYETSDLRMIVMLPDDQCSDAIYLINHLNREKFVSIINSLTNKRIIEVTLPRFALDAQKISLQRTIKQMGAKDMFDEYSANLGDISAHKNLHLTKIVNKAFIIVDERGSSVTPLRVELKKHLIHGSLINLNPVIFKCNHPFVFFITDKATNVAIFMGLFGDPREMLEVVTDCELTQKEIHDLLSSQ